MPTYFVRQPNGKLARFSTVVDAFCEVDMSESDALRWCRERMGEDEAREKVRRAVADEPTDGPGGRRCCDQGLVRWHDSLATILHVHGTAGLAKFLAAYPSTYEPADADG